MPEMIVRTDYNKDWPRRFQIEAERLKTALGSICIRIHHVGSTAVPGLAAKPIIDIALESTIYPPTESMNQVMKGLEYENMGEGSVAGRYWFRKGTPRAFHVHWVSEGGEVAVRQVALRDFLKNHPNARLEYERIKRDAAIGRDVDSADYALAKSPFITKALSQ